MCLCKHEPIKVSYHPPKFASRRHCGSGNGFSLSSDLRGPRDQRAMWFYGQEPIKLIYHAAKFGGRMHSGSGDKIFLVYHMILT